MMHNGTTWVALDQASVEFLTLLAATQPGSVSNSLSTISSSLSEGGAFDLTPLIQALNTDSANLVQSTNSIAAFVKALAIITEYWKQISEVNVERVTNGTMTLGINQPLVSVPDPLVSDRPIVTAHNSARSTIQS